MNGFFLFFLYVIIIEYYDYILSGISILVIIISFAKTPWKRKPKKMGVWKFLLGQPQRLVPICTGIIILIIFFCLRLYPVLSPWQTFTHSVNQQADNQFLQEYPSQANKIHFQVDIPKGWKNDSDPLSNTSEVIGTIYEFNNGNIDIWFTNRKEYKLSVEVVDAYAPQQYFKLYGEGKIPHDDFVSLKNRLRQGDFSMRDDSSTTYFQTTELNGSPAIFMKDSGTRKIVTEHNGLLVSVTQVIGDYTNINKAEEDNVWNHAITSFKFLN